MTQSAFESTGEQMLGHMRWANAQLLGMLAELPDEALHFTSNFDDWTVARIAHHLVGVSGRLRARAIESAMPMDLDVPTTAADFKVLAGACWESDSALIELAGQPDRECTFDLFGKTETAHRSVLLAQAVHHSQEHRVQIAGVLASNGMNVINLDKLSLWYFNSVLK